MPSGTCQWLTVVALLSLVSGPAAIATSLPTQRPIPAPRALPLVQVDLSQDRFPAPPEMPLELPPNQPIEERPAEVDIPFAITEIQVVGSTLLEAATLEQLVAPYENQMVTLRTLQRIADSITRQYLNRGYFTSRAIVPPQPLEDGVVEIQVIEGELAAIEVQGTDTLQDYVRSRIALADTRPLNQIRLEDQLRLLRLDPLFAEVSASLQAGEEVGQSRLIVRVVEAPRIAGVLSSDTYTAPAVGTVRLGAQLDVRNPADLGGTLFSTATWTNTAGSKVYELGYRVPVNPMNGTLLLRVAANEFKITDADQPAFVLNPEGTTDIYEISFRQPLVRTPRQEFALSLGYRYRDGSTLLAGFISEATQTQVISLGQAYQYRNPTGAWAVQSQFRLGLERSAETLLAEASEQTFFSWLGQLQRVRRLDDNQLLIFQGSLQLTPDRLPGSEQFFSGGGLSVRGYDQNQRFGDNGLQLSLADQITLARTASGTPSFQLVPFLEAAYVWSHQDRVQVTENNFMVGTGLGIVMTPTDQLRLQVDLAYPLVDIQELVTDDPPGVRFYFSATYQF